MSDPLVDDEHFRRKDTGVWQRKLLPFMMASLVVVGIVFFAGTFYIYNTLTQRLQHVDSPIAEAVDRAQALAPNAQFLDWYVRATLEERAIAGRQRQYNAVVEGRLWTRLMGFLAGMVMVLSPLALVALIQLPTPSAPMRAMPLVKPAGLALAAKPKNRLPALSAVTGVVMKTAASSAALLAL